MHDLVCPCLDTASVRPCSRGNAVRAIGACLALPAACREEASDERTLEKRRVMRGLSGAQRAERAVLIVLIGLCSWCCARLWCRVHAAGSCSQVPLPSLTPIPTPPSPTLSPTDPVPRGLLTLCPGAY